MIQNTNTEYEYRVRNPCQNWESDPIQNTEYEYRIRKPRQTVTARECCRAQYRIRNTNTAYESCAKPYRLDLATALRQVQLGAGPYSVSYSVLCIGTDRTLSQYGLSWIRRTSVSRVSNLVFRIPYSVFCIVHTSRHQQNRIRIRGIQYDS